MTTQPRFTVNPDKTVTDHLLGLTWSQEAIAVDVDFADAEKAVAALGEGWRLPTVEELFQLADRSRIRPAIDTEAFPDTKSSYYWSSTPYAGDTSAVWVVHFYYGGSLSHRRSYLACVRAVRSSQ